MDNTKITSASFYPVFLLSMILSITVRNIYISLLMIIIITIIIIMMMMTLIQNPQCGSLPVH